MRYRMHVWPLLGVFFFYSACAGPKVWRAADFDEVTKEEGDLFYGRILPKVVSGKRPTCRVEINSYQRNGVVNAEMYELPPDGMVFFWGRKGTTWFGSLSCYRNKNWMPTVGFLEKLPTFVNKGGGKITYFGTVTVDVQDVDDLPARPTGGNRRYTTTYSVSDDQAAATQILHSEFEWTREIPIEKSIAVPTAPEE